jgi:chloride channel 7
MVFVLEPGEVVLVPRGWWHYAAALDPSVTVMRNFYHAGTNADALVKTILAKVRAVARGC